MAAGDDAHQKLPLGGSWQAVGLTEEGYRSTFFIKDALDGMHHFVGRIPAARNVAELSCQLNGYYQKFLSS